MPKCKNDTCQNEKSWDRAECPSCRGKRRRGTNYETKWKSDGDSPKILFFDIETKPNIVYSWDSQLWSGHISIDQIIEPGGVLCVSAKWYGEEETLFWSEWGDGFDAMRQAAWDLLDEADFVVHYYGSQFDVKHLNTIFLEAGMFPPSPFKQVDLKLAVSHRFKLPSNKLQFVSRVLNIEGKEEHEGFKLWSRVLNGDKDAQARMTSYCIRDTDLLVECYEALLPWLPSHPHRHLYSGTGGCPRCGHEDTLVEAGMAYTNLSRYLQYSCTACGSFFRASKRVGGVTLQDAVLS